MHKRKRKRNKRGVARAHGKVEDELCEQKARGQLIAQSAQAT